MKGNINKTNILLNLYPDDSSSLSWCIGFPFPKSTPSIGALELHPSNITEYVLPDQTPKAPLII